MKLSLRRADSVELGILMSYQAVRSGTHSTTLIDALDAFHFIAYYLYTSHYVRKAIIVPKIKLPRLLDTPKQKRSSSPDIPDWSQSHNNIINVIKNH